MEQGSTKTDADGTALFAGEAWFGIDPVRWTVCRLTNYVLATTACMSAS